MMMIGEENRPNPTIHVPPWPIFDESTDGMLFPLPVSGISANFNGNVSGSRCSGEYSPSFMSAEALLALQRFLPSNEVDTESDITSRESDIPIDAFSCDEFRMYEFKVRRCARGRSHDWTECPYAHPGEKARRRDPRKFHYSGTACPDFRKGNCKRGDSCEYAHGVFECWLHPARYRTQPCKDGTNCRRRVCFFAHTQEQLRVLSQQSPRAGFVAESPPSYDGSPLRHALDSYFVRGTQGSSLYSPPISPPSDSPPMSPSTPSLSRSLGSNSINEMVVSLRNLQLSKLKSGFGSPRGGSTLRPAFNSLPSTPTRTPTQSGIGYMDFWDRGNSIQEEPTMDRVESGREIRAKMFEKLSKENSLGREDRVDSSVTGPAPDVGWISELVK